MTNRIEAIMYNSNSNDLEVSTSLKQKQTLNSSNYKDLVNHFILLSQTWHHMGIFPIKNSECIPSFFFYIPFKPQKDLSRLM